ncbi:unnamed protein product [Brugia timori]|uniref:Transmembrane protein n=1 Tax=Brugia timori TaxID=42155 RepID=A0A0R3QDW8_9BILA|nr:unnamed protein product [Brugia timori]
MGGGFVITGQCSGQQTRGAVRRRMVALVVGVWLVGICVWVVVVVGVQVSYVSHVT